MKRLSSSACTSLTNGSVFVGRLSVFGSRSRRTWTSTGLSLDWQEVRSAPRCLLSLLSLKAARVHHFFVLSECGGKNFHFVHTSAEVQSVVTGTIRSAFEYGGQKCSACSRMYVPDSLWPQIKEQLLAIHKDIRVGDVSTEGCCEVRSGERLCSLQISCNTFSLVFIRLGFFNNVSRESERVVENLFMKDDSDLTSLAYKP